MSLRLQLFIISIGSCPPPGHLDQRARCDLLAADFPSHRLTIPKPTFVLTIRPHISNSTKATFLCRFTLTIIASRPHRGPDWTTTLPCSITPILISMQRLWLLLKASMRARSSAAKGTNDSPILSKRVNSGISRSVRITKSSRSLTTITYPGSNGFWTSIHSPAFLICVAYRGEKHSSTAPGGERSSIREQNLRSAPVVT